MSPSPLSGSESQQLTPLSALTSRLGSQPLTVSATRLGSYSPQPSLNGTHMTTDGWASCCRTMSCISVSNCCLSAAGGLWPPNMAGMSCQTSSPSRSAQ